MTKKQAVFLIIALVIGLAGGYSAAYLAMQPEIDILNDSLNETRSDLSSTQSQLALLQSKVSSLESSLTNIRKATLEGNLKSVYQENWFGTDKYRVTGMVVNYGTEKASEVQLILRWYKGGVLLHTNAAHLDAIAGRSFQSIDITYDFEGVADSFKYEIRSK